MPGGPVRKPQLPSRRRLAAVVLFMATVVLLVAFSNPTGWSYLRVAAAAAAVGAVYGSIPLWPRPRTVRSWALPASKPGVVRPVTPAADGLTALSYLLMVLDCIVGVVAVLLGARDWLGWLALGLFVGFAVVVLLSSLVDLPLVPPEEP